MQRRPYAEKKEVLQMCKHEDSGTHRSTELGTSGESEQSGNERDLPRDVGL
jgi:hypothetical protein